MSQQQIRPKQIQPGTTEGHVLKTVSGITQWAPETGGGGGGGGTLYYAESIGDGSSTTIDIVHVLDTEDVIVQMHEEATGELVYKDYTVIDVNTIRMVFTTAPTLDQYRVIIAAGSASGGGGVSGSHWELVFFNDEPLLFNHDGVHMEVLP